MLLVAHYCAVFFRIKPAPQTTKAATQRSTS